LEGTVLVDLSPSALVAAIEANQAAYLRDQGRCPLVELHEEPGWTWLITGFPFPNCNQVLAARMEAAGLDAAIEAALAPFRARRLPMTWRAPAPPLARAAWETICWPTA
jgi:hypothetical protein